MTNFMVLANSQPFEYIIRHFISKLSVRPNRHFFVVCHFRSGDIETGDNSAYISFAIIGDLSFCRELRVIAAGDFIDSTPVYIGRKTFNHKSNAEKK